MKLGEIKAEYLSYMLEFFVILETKSSLLIGQLKMTPSNVTVDYWVKYG